MMLSLQRLWKQRQLTCSGSGAPVAEPPPFVTADADSARLTLYTSPWGIPAFPSGRATAGEAVDNGAAPATALVVVRDGGPGCRAKTESGG